MNKQAFVALQKIRHEVETALPGQRTVMGGYRGELITVKQAAALLAWIDRAQIKLGKEAS